MPTDAEINLKLEMRQIEQKIAELYPDEFPLYLGDWAPRGVWFPRRHIGEWGALMLVDRLVDEVELLRQHSSRSAQSDASSSWEDGAPVDV